MRDPASPQSAFGAAQCVQSLFAIHASDIAPGAPSNKKGPPLTERPLYPSPRPSPRTRGEGGVAGLAVPAELLRLAARALAEHDVDQRRSAVVHGFVEGAADVLWILDEEALAAKGFHDAVITRAVDQRLGLHVEHRVFRDLGHARADAAIVEHDDLDRQVGAAQRL